LQEQDATKDESAFPAPNGHSVGTATYFSHDFDYRVGHNVLIQYPPVNLAMLVGPEAQITAGDKVSLPGFQGW
jgi:hypothetical protein